MTQRHGRAHSWDGGLLLGSRQMLRNSDAYPYLTLLRTEGPGVIPTLQVKGIKCRKLQKSIPGPQTHRAEHRGCCTGLGAVNEFTQLMRSPAEDSALTWVHLGEHGRLGLFWAPVMSSGQGSLVRGPDRRCGRPPDAWSPGRRGRRGGVRGTEALTVLGPSPGSCTCCRLQKRGLGGLNKLRVSEGEIILEIWWVLCPQGCPYRRGRWSLDRQERRSHLTTG